MTVTRINRYTFWCRLQNISYFYPLVHFLLLPLVLSCWYQTERKRQAEPQGVPDGRRAFPTDAGRARRTQAAPLSPPLSCAPGDLRVCEEGGHPTAHASIRTARARLIAIARFASLSTLALHERKYFHATTVVKATDSPHVHVCACVCVCVARASAERHGRLVYDATHVRRLSPFSLHASPRCEEAFSRGHTLIMHHYPSCSRPLPGSTF